VTKENPATRRRVLLGALASGAAVAVLGVAALQLGGEPARRTATDTGLGTAKNAAPDTASPRAQTGPAQNPQAEGTQTGPAQDAIASSAGSPSVPVWEGPTPPPIDERLSKGKAGAPVTIVEFGDFKCPNCRRFAQAIEPALKSRYLDTGVVRMYWRDYPIRGHESVQAAVAARAAARQSRFWAFHDALYTGERPDLTDGGLRAAAKRAGLDLARFDADRRARPVRQAVDTDLNFALDLGMPGTPAFLINGHLLFGAQPLATFVQAIEKARRGG
jgi:protein-disulfide isomerase